MRSSLKKATLKIYQGAPHGMCSTLKDRVNAELLSFTQQDRKQRPNGKSLAGRNIERVLPGASEGMHHTSRFLFATMVLGYHDRGTRVCHRRW